MLMMLLTAADPEFPFTTLYRDRLLDVVASNVPRCVRVES